jgi:hypothetical protein
MPQKTITLLLYGADRQLWSGPTARLRVTDPNRRNDVRVLVSQPLQQPVVEMNLDVPFDAGQIYVVSVEVKGYRPAWQIIWHETFLKDDAGRTVEVAGVTMRLMLIPRKPTSSDLQFGHRRLTERGGLADVWTLTELEYQALPASHQMALLNIEAKLRETFLGTESVLSHVTGLRGIDPDRLFILAAPALKQLVDESPDFAEAAGHPVPPSFPGLPAHPDSWKHTRYPSGNVQLSFASVVEPWPPGAFSPTSSFSVDVDVDLARGFSHAIEWLENKLIKPGQTTDQSKVYGLLFSQGIYPLYTLNP